MAFKIFGELKIVKPGVGFELMAYRFKVSPLIHCTTLLGEQYLERNYFY